MTLDQLVFPTRPRRLIVLSFGQLSTLHPDRAPDLQQEFDQLDQTGWYFESCCAQDVRTGAHWASAFGGATAFAELNRSLAAHSRTATLFAATDDTVESLAPLGFSHVVCGADRAVHPVDVGLRDVPRAADGLLWVHVASPDPRVMAEQIQAVRAEAARGRSASADGCWLIVTASRGRPFAIEAPLESGICESLIRVPLWIAAGDSSPLRAQTLVGTRELIPAMQRFLFADERTEPADASDTPEVAAGSPVEAAAGRGTPPSTGSADEASEHVVVIEGDEFRAVRSQDGLLVVSRGHSESDQACRAERLYLKPEDVWNVHDQATVYTALRDELRRALASDGDVRAPAAP